MGSSEIWQYNYIIRYTSISLGEYLDMRKNMCGYRGSEDALNEIKNIQSGDFSFFFLSLNSTTVLIGKII